MNSQSGFDYFPSVIANEEGASEYLKKNNICWNMVAPNNLCLGFFNHSIEETP